MSKQFPTTLVSAIGGGILLGAGLTTLFCKAGACNIFCSDKKATKSCCASKPAEKPVKVVTVTGAAGQIGYSIVFMIASGRMLGPDQPIELRLLDLPQMENVLKGLVMELQDCAFSLLRKIVPTSSYEVAFHGCDYALLVGARPRGQGMTRADLLQANKDIFKGQGEALNNYAARNVKILVVGNPANTNAAIVRQFAPNLPASNISAMTRLDQNRAQAQIAEKLNLSVDKVKNIIIWGNHSGTQYPYVDAGVVELNENKHATVREAINNDNYLNNDFIKTVQNRGTAIIDVTKKSSAASAANAAVEHMRDWVLGTAPGQFVSMAVNSDGNSYGIPSGLIFSFPVTCKNGEWKIVDGLPITEFSRTKLQATTAELEDEKKTALQQQ